MISGVTREDDGKMTCVDDEDSELSEVSKTDFWQRQEQEKSEGWAQ
jgi:hypothetical protein